MSIPLLPRYLIAAVILFTTAGALASDNCDADYCIDWHTISSGGEIHAQSDDGQWQLSGTVGQWNATEARELSGGQWRLTGGFWGMTLEELADRLFSDRFEED
jgi:hypothetical protein